MAPGRAFFLPERPDSERKRGIPGIFRLDAPPRKRLDDIDFLAAYVIRKNLWYVVPADAFVPRATVHFNYGPQSQGMFEMYRETWCLLACSSRARGRGDIPKRCRCEEMPVRCVVCPKR